MEFDAALALAAATAVLVAIPGPNVALITANVIAHGPRFGVVTVIGTTVGTALQVAAVVLGFATLMEAAASAFVWLKWAGVAYLIWCGVAMWRRGQQAMPDMPPDRRPVASVFWQGLLLASINPKTLLFNAAFLPQFIDAHGGPAALATAALIYLGVFLAGDLLWVAAGHSARPTVLRLGRRRHQLTGGLFLASGIGLALARAER